MEQGLKGESQSVPEVPGDGVVLETSRLILRLHVMQDADALEAVLGDPVGMEFYPAALDRQGVKDWIIRNMARYQRDGFGKWAVLMKGTGEIVGSCGCALQEVEGRNEIEVGYNLRRDLWGNGYATEAAQACTEYAFRELGAVRVISMIRPENLRSIRVAEKNGMVCEKIIFWRDYNHCVYTRPQAKYDGQTQI